jgi:pyroglutamyl-peptidase
VPAVGLVLPCTFDGAIATLLRALDATRPRIVLALGLAAGRHGFSLEQVAINLVDARIADNAGAQPIDVAVVERGPAAHFTTLPVKPMASALRAAGFEASVSYSAGTFVCNHVFYGLQHALRRRRSARSGFMHLPCLPAQAEGRPCLALAAQIEGVRIALDTALAIGAATGGPAASEGRIA